MSFDKTIQFAKEFAIGMVFLWACIQFMGCSNMLIDRDMAKQVISGVSHE